MLSDKTDKKELGIERKERKARHHLLQYVESTFLLHSNLQHISPRRRSVLKRFIIYPVI